MWLKLTQVDLNQLVVLSTSISLEVLSAGHRMEGGVGCDCVTLATYRRAVGKRAGGGLLPPAVGPTPDTGLQAVGSF